MFDLEKLYLITTPILFTILAILSCIYLYKHVTQHRINRYTAIGYLFIAICFEAIFSFIFYTLLAFFINKHFPSMFATESLDIKLSFSSLIFIPIFILVGASIFIAGSSCLFLAKIQTPNKPQVGTTK